MLTKIITDPNLAWNSSMLKDPKEYTFNISNRAVNELKQDMGILPNVNPPLGSVNYKQFKSNFPELTNDINIFRNQYLENGKGFGIINKLDLDSKEEIQNGYWLIANILGTPLIQNADDHRLVEVTDLGKSMDEGGRYHQTREGGNLHTDSPQWENPPRYLGLVCMGIAKTGGESKLASAYEVHNRILSRDTDILSVLYEPFHFEKRGKLKPNESQTTFKPVFEYDGNSLKFRYLRKYMETGPDRVGEELTSEQVTAMDMVDNILDDKKVSCEAPMEIGQIQFLNNERVIHGRNTYTDHKDKKRLLLRTWIAS